MVKNDSAIIVACCKARPTFFLNKVGPNSFMFFPFDQNIAFRRRNEAVYQFENRCFTRAGRADKRHDFLFFNISSDSFDDGHLLIGKMDIDEFNRLFDQIVHQNYLFQLMIFIHWFQCINVPGRF